MMKKVTIPYLWELKRKGEKVVLLTAYDYMMAAIEDMLGVEVILVGDSYGTTLMGYSDTLPVTMEEMLVATRAVARAVKNAMLIVDMPFMSYQVSPEYAIRNAGRFMKIEGVDGVKLEGGVDMAPTVERLVKCGIPVMGHVGLLPQSIKQVGGYRARGRTDAEVKQLIADAKALESAGAFCIIVEAVKKEVTPLIKEAVDIPVYGIGAGPHCDGQILVVYDILGLTLLPKVPRFVKKYADIKSIIEAAIKQYIEEVKSGRYPDDKHSY